jgi:hypothetical protein
MPSAKCQNVSFLCIQGSRLKQFFYTLKCIFLLVAVNFGNAQGAKFAVCF